MKKSTIGAGLIIFSTLVFFWMSSGVTQENTIRVGFFPNITHAQPLIGRADGTYQKSLGDTQIEWTAFNAGPAVIEAVFAGHLDLAYVGPSPAVNGYVKSGGDALRIVAGSASGGASLVVREDVGISTPEDFKGKKIATPQMGNTQDVALRAWLSSKDLKTTDKGGDVQVMPMTNADHVTLFLKKELDASWTVEPWVSILTETAGGKIFFEESTLWPNGQYATAVLIANRKFLEKNPDAVRRFLEAHVELTDRINSRPEEAKALVAQEIFKETRKELPEKILNPAFSRVRFTVDAMQASVQEQAKAAFKAGFLKSEPDLKELYDLRILDEILSKKPSA
jgi:NitT/TauT family transport system substrate-binding protein